MVDNVGMLLTGLALIWALGPLVRALIGVLAAVIRNTLKGD